MYLKQIFILLFLILPLSTSTPVLSTITPRDATAVLNDLSKLHTSLDTLAKAITSYTGGLISALDIQSKEMVIERDLDQATTDTNAATPFTVIESTRATSALLGLEPNIRISLDGLVQKKALIDRVGVGSIVRMDLRNLQSKTGLLSTALQHKATDTDKETLASKTTELNAGFESAIRAYS
ncbi:hypothetical protein BBP40_005565 [Aspergillus hancockii]|nr:hypothetical protein BBP40_005565 [Aspergillus hancockii]